jgi:LPXTG-site transpeptidase (sortase) family protein
MDDERRLRQTRALGVIIALSGVLCLGGGVALLSWRLLKPDEAILLPPGMDGTPEMTPTPGVLGRPIPPPPLPTDPAQIVILPVSELPTATPTPVQPGPAVTPTHVQPAPTVTPSATVIIGRTPTATPPYTPSLIPPTLSPVPTESATAFSPPTSTSTAVPTVTPTPAPTTVPAIPDRILIDAIGLDAPVVPVGQQPLTLGGQLYSQWKVPDERAAGWHQSSAPLGQIGNTVLNGHHNIYGEVFHYLVLLKPGDVVTLESQGKRRYYIVAQTMTLAEEGQPVEVRQANARWILPTDDERVTLITCWPYNANTHRLVVIALPLVELGDRVEIP